MTLSPMLLVPLQTLHDLPLNYLLMALLVRSITSRNPNLPDILPPKIRLAKKFKLLVKPRMWMQSNGCHPLGKRRTTGNPKRNNRKTQEPRTPLLTIINVRSNTPAKYVVSTISLEIVPIGKKANDSSKVPNIRQFSLTCFPIRISSWFNMTPLLREDTLTMIRQRLHPPKYWCVTKRLI